MLILYDVTLYKSSRGMLGRSDIGLFRTEEAAKAAAETSFRRLKDVFNGEQGDEKERWFVSPLPDPAYPTVYQVDIRERLVEDA